MLRLREARMKIVARSKFTLRARYSFYASLLLAAGTMTARPAFGDEGGVSFWLPGFVGSLAATPQVPGFSFATLYYHSSVSAGGNVAFARQVSHGNITANFTGNLNANINGSADLSMAIGLHLRHADIGRASLGYLGRAVWRRPSFSRYNADWRGGTDWVYKVGRPQ